MENRGVILLLIGTLHCLELVTEGHVIINRSTFNIQGENITKPGERTRNNTTINPELCNFNLTMDSLKFFDSRLQLMEPDFVAFRIYITNTYDTDPEVNITYEHTLFEPRLWFWTYDTPKGHFPYLYLNIDYGILSFGLLDAKTFEVKRVVLNPMLKDNQSCSIHFGKNDSMEQLTNALQDLVVNVVEHDVYKYETNYFCYLVENQDIKKSWKYFAALYFNFPAPLVHFECCEVWFHYSENKFVSKGCNKPFPKWDLCYYGPYILGVLLLLYFPIILFKICDALTKGETVESFDYDMVVELDVPLSPGPTWEFDWVFLNGKPPLTFWSVITSCFGGVMHQYPVCATRLRRFIAVLLIPFVIYIKILMYFDGITKDELKIKVSDFAERGMPLGYLAMLGNSPEDRMKSFAPAFGGPVGMACIYYILSVVLIVFPRSLKQIVENGMPTRRNWSPLFFGVDEILHIGMMSTETEPGYNRAAAICKGRFYMLFTGTFWKRLSHLQKRRYQKIRRFSKCMFALCLPLLTLACLLETIACLVYFAIPFVSFSVIMIKGASTSVMAQRLYYHRLNALLRIRLFWAIGSLLVFITFIMFAYSLSLIFLKSSVFISKIIIYCFVAVVFMPSASFGYLFFFVVLLYYIVHLVKGFGEVYLELLSTGIERSLDLDAHVNHVSYQDGHLLISNVRAPNIRSIRVNNTHIDVPQNSLEKIKATSDVARHTRQVNSVHGIPKELFEYLVKKYRPVHIQLLKLIFQLTFIVTLVALTLSITSKFNSSSSSEEGPEVMHILFMVTVGALPRVLEVLLTDGSEVVKKQLEETRVEQTIVRYWRTKADTDLELS
ncbi:uncharacterized protein LOC128242600 [Mya arenaria]|uniref:uncharacterized protein LOC128242600 n=1 Tax=Mya arenaria TaxID=6604 RepID=UPI0022E8F0A3|nr:uncharacterized protein LOC128242600 [Mya arenaria]